MDVKQAQYTGGSRVEHGGTMAKYSQQVIAQGVRRAQYVCVDGRRAHYMDSSRAHYGAHQGTLQVGEEQ